MSERPILFTGGMVRAILCGRKTQTRRVIKPQPTFESGAWWLLHKTGRAPIANASGRCCAGPATYAPWRRGDRLWVRETFSAWFSGNPWGEWPRELRTQKYASNVFYRATHNYPDDDQKWVPSIFMPRWASRITPQIVNVRVERVQDITEADAVAEGVASVLDFSALWDAINQSRGYGWNTNPWVWVVEFRRATEAAERKKS